MPQQTQQTAKNGQGRYDFKPIDSFDVNTMEPDAQAGQYEATIFDVKILATRTDGYPMLVVGWKLDSAADDDNEKSIGAEVSDFIVIKPEGDRKGRMGKLRLRQLCEKMEVDLDVVPTAMRSKGDFAELIRALKNRSGTVWVTHREDQSTGETRIGVSYTAPRGAALTPVEDEDEPPAKKPSGGGKKRR